MLRHAMAKPGGYSWFISVQQMTQILSSAKTRRACRIFQSSGIHDFCLSFQLLKTKGNDTGDCMLAFTPQKERSQLDIIDIMIPGVEHELQQEN
jgi:hypothetical protein